jgi:DNA-binding beta-propeller fold protein YncE
MQEGLRKEEEQVRQNKAKEEAAEEEEPSEGEEESPQGDALTMMMPRKTVLATAIPALIALATAAPGLAAGEPHPFVTSFGRSSTEVFSNPNGIAIDESTGDVYVADIGTDTVYKFAPGGKPEEFSALHVDALAGTATPAGSFSFPELPHTPAAIAVDNSTSPSDPSRGDLYVMDAGHGVIDKFSPTGEYLSQIAGFEPATGFSYPRELLGLAVDAGGTVHADISSEEVGNSLGMTVDEYDDSTANHLIAEQSNPYPTRHLSGIPERGEAGGFAVGPTGDAYMIFRECACTAKLGQQLAGLGLLDNYHSEDVAIAADPASGHVYVDDSSSVAEWDAGALNGSPPIPSSSESEGDGVLVSRFGSALLSGTTGQGGIAVNGSTGEVYVSNPADGKVYVFGSEAPAVAAGAATNISKETATLNGTVDPRGQAITQCSFEYGLADGFGRASYEHTVPCEPEAAMLGAGTSAVPVSAQIGGLTPGLLYRFRLIATNAISSRNESDGLFAAAQGSGFGVKNFEVSFLNEDGTPDTQAGSHPYKFLNTIEFNSHYTRVESNADSPYVREPVGTLRDLKLDLPPGFVGDPNATAKKCTLSKLFEEKAELDKRTEGGCPPESLLGTFEAKWDEHVFGYDTLVEPLYNLVAPRGSALQLGANYVGVDVFINNGLLAGGDYPVQASVEGAPPEAPVLRTRVTISGVLTPCVRVPQGSGKYSNSSCTATAGGGEGEFEKEPGRSKAFLTMPTGCHGPLRSTISMDSYQEPGHWVEAEALTRNSAGQPVSLTGCSDLIFLPTISVSPDTNDASTSSGLAVNVHVPQNAAFNPNGLAESSLRDTTVTLPEGVAINPAGADGLEACSEGLAGFEIGRGVDGSGFEEFNKAFEPGVKTALFTPTALEGLQPGVSFCPGGSKIGTVKLKTPLLEHELEGAVYLASQNVNPFGSLIAMYMMIEDPISGSTVKLIGEVSLTATGQIVTTFKNTPDLPFENLELHFFGGERAPLSTPARCGTYTTKAVFTPWDGNGPVTSESSFSIDHGPHGSPCPGANLPFEPSLTAGTTSIQGGGFSPFTMTMSREDGQQSLRAISLKMPPGLSGLLTGVELCPEPQADEGLCGPNSLIGETTVAVGVGNDPFSVKGGRVYLTGPYRGAPFGLSIVNPAKAGPFDVERDTSKPTTNMPTCDCVVVRAKIEVDPITTDLTVTSDNEGPYGIPTILDGIPLQIKDVNVTINRPRFTFNPTNCNPLSITGSLDSTEGATDALSVPFQATNCARLGFKPQFSVSTSGRTSRQRGASLHVKLVYPKLPFGSQANIASVKVDLPKQLPSRLSTLQKACPHKVFEINPASCPAGSRVGEARASTPLLPVPLSGPAYFVSYGGAKFPELVIALQGYGVTLDLHGETYINPHTNITSSTFHTVPDAPVGTFELNLQQGPDSALAANANLCRITRTVHVKRKLTVRVNGHGRTVTRRIKKTLPASLAMPTAFTAQNGAVIHQDTPIGVTGCLKSKKAKKHTTGKRKGARRRVRR